MNTEAARTQIREAIAGATSYAMPSDGDADSWIAGWCVGENDAAETRAELFEAEEGLVRALCVAIRRHGGTILDGAVALRTYLRPKSPRMIVGHDVWVLNQAIRVSDKTTRLCAEEPEPAIPEA